MNISSTSQKKNITCEISTRKVIYNDNSVYFRYFFKRNGNISDGGYSRVENNLEHAFSEAFRSLTTWDVLSLQSTNKNSRVFPEYLQKKIRVIFTGNKQLLKEKCYFAKEQNLQIDIKLITLNDLQKMANFKEQEQNSINELFLNQLEAVTMAPHVIEADKKSVKLMGRIKECYIAEGCKFSIVSDFTREDIEEEISRARVRENARSSVFLLNKNAFFPEEVLN